MHTTREWERVPHLRLVLPLTQGTLKLQTMKFSFFSSIVTKLHVVCGFVGIHFHVFVLLFLCFLFCLFLLPLDTNLSLGYFRWAKWNRIHSGLERRKQKQLNWEYTLFLNKYCITPLPSTSLFQGPLVLLIFFSLLFFALSLLWKILFWQGPRITL